LNYTLLGPVRVRSVGGGYLPLGRGRPQKILAALLLNVNRPVSTDRLIDVVWGDKPPGTARQQTQNSIGMLKRALADAEVESSIRRWSATYTLEIEETHIDSVVFRSSCVQAQQAVERGDEDRAALHLEQALALWSGSALEDIHSDALAVNAEELEERRLEAAQALVGIRFKQGRHVELIGKLTMLTAQYPYHEGLHRALAEALHGASRRGEALRTLAELAERLDCELSIGPEAATLELVRRLTTNRPPEVAVSGEPTMRELITALRDVTRLLSAVTRTLSDFSALPR